MQTPPCVFKYFSLCGSVTSDPPMSFGCPVKVDIAARADAVFIRGSKVVLRSVSRGRKNVDPETEQQRVFDYRSTLRREPRENRTSDLLLSSRFSVISIVFFVSENIFHFLYISY